MFDLRRITLKACILTQRGLSGIRNLFAVSDLLVMGLARLGRAQVTDALRPRVDNDHILVRMHLFLATVMKRLFFRLFRPLAAALRAINNVIRRLPRAAFRLGKLSSVAFGHHPEGDQSLAQDGQQAMDPFVRTRLTETKQRPQHDLQRIRFLMHQDEQQLLLRAVQLTNPPTPDLSFAFPFSQSFVTGILGPVGFAKGREHCLEFLDRQARQSKKFARIPF